MDTNRVIWVGNLPSPVPGVPSRAVRERILSVRSPDQALQELRQSPCEAIVLAFPVPGWSSANLVSEVRQIAPHIPLLVRDADCTLADTELRARYGNLYPLPLDADVLGQIECAIEDQRARQLAQLAQSTSREEWENLLVGESAEMRQIAHVIRMVGARRSTVLITGETGTGKELAARALHLAGPRRRGPWVALNCSALPDNLLEAELFGHVRGAFTGANQNRVGRFEQAHTGTLFLDEIGDLPLDLQAKLLRVLQEREFQRLGSSETVRVDIRVVAATNCELMNRVEKGTFREDLYYRLNVVPLEMPPLRYRPGDIPLLAAHFAQKVCRFEDLPLKRIAPDALERLAGFAWPGNVRQLENAVEMAIALSGDRSLLVSSDFPLGGPVRLRNGPTVSAPAVSVPDAGLDYEETLALIERSILEQALHKTGGNKKAAADMLRLKRTTLSAKIRSLDQAACN